MFKSLNFVALILGITIANVSGVCDYDWVPYKDDKCIKVFDFLASYHEAEVLCNISFDSTLFELDSEEEQTYITVYLMRLFNITNNLWLRKSTSLSTRNLTWINNVTKTNECAVMLSFTGAQNEIRNVGKLESKPCDDFHGFVCQKVKNIIIETANVTKTTVENPFYINKSLKSNNTEINLITGLYYRFANREQKNFSLTYFGNDICMTGNNGSECKQYFKDNSVTTEANSNSFIFIEQNGAYRIKEKSTLKELFIKNGDLRLYPCPDKIQDSCYNTYNISKISYLWNVNRFNKTNYYQISDYPQNKYLLGLSVHLEANNTSVTSLVLYNFNEGYASNKTHWHFDFESLNLNGELFDIELTDNIETLIAKSTTQIDLIETVSIINDSPASLDHAVSVTKSFTETFSVSFGVSQRYLDSFTLHSEQSDQLGKSGSQTESVTNSLGDVASKSISNSLAKTRSQSESSHSSQSNSNSRSDSNSQTNSKSATNSNSDSNTNTHTAGGSATAGGNGLFFHAEVSVNYQYTNTHTSEHSNSETNENSKTSSSEQTQSQSNENGRSNENSASATASQEFSLNNQQTRDQSKQKSNETTQSQSNTVTNGTEKSSQRETTYDQRNDYSNSTTHTYVIDKTINVPPYSAIKISSFINWVKDLKFTYNILLKFNANSLRRKKDGSNEWTTLDADAVKLILEKTGFPGSVYYHTENNVYVKVISSFKGSFGIESYFVAKEIDRTLT